MRLVPYFSLKAKGFNRFERAQYFLDNMYHIVAYKHP